MRLPPGVGLILTGSGVYWILSSRLISSFSVLTAGMFNSTETGMTLVLVSGVAASVLGLWTIHADIDRLNVLLNRGDGWMFVLPVLLAGLDLFLTAAGLSSRAEVVELNPFVSRAVEGSAVLFSFTVSYIALSQGVALLVLGVGGWVFRSSRALVFLPYSAICGTASIGVFSNLLVLSGFYGILTLVAASLGAGLLGTLVFFQFKRNVSHFSNFR